MRCAVNNVSIVKETSHGIDTDYRCVSAAVWRRRRILGSQSRLLVTSSFSQSWSLTGLLRYSLIRLKLMSEPERLDVELHVQDMSKEASTHSANVFDNGLAIRPKRRRSGTAGSRPIIFHRLQHAPRILAE